jgi:hypothetical protein
MSFPKSSHANRCGIASPVSAQCYWSSCATPGGVQPDGCRLTTEIDANPGWVACHSTGRWSVEVTFRDEKQDSGGEVPPDSDC